MPDTTNLTAGQLSAARRTYTGTAADLEAILEEWGVHIVDEVDDNPERNPHVGFVPAEGTSLVDALEAWKDAAVRSASEMGAPTAFPGRPGSRWRDTDGDMWIHGDDRRLHAVGCSLDPNGDASIYGPITRVGGEF